MFYPKVNIPKVNILVAGQRLAAKLLLPAVSFPGLCALLELQEFHFPRTTVHLTHRTNSLNCLSTQNHSSHGGKTRDLADGAGRGMGYSGVHLTVDSMYCYQSLLFIL